MFSDSNPDYVKVVMLGEGRVGKTSLTLRYVRNQFDDAQESTINASYIEKTVEIDSKTSLKLAIWDTAGQEKFHALAPIYYRDAEGAVLVYDITFKESFDRVNKWIRELREFGNPDIVLVIVGNKCDLENQRQVKKEQAESFAKEVGALHFHGSAKSGAGIQEIFKSLTTQIHKKNLNKRSNKPGRNQLTVTNKDSKKVEKKKCCD